MRLRPAAFARYRASSASRSSSPDATGGCGGGIAAAVGYEEEELLAAVAVDGLAGAGRCVEAQCDLAQDVVAGEVTVVIVVELEVVDVE
jgi:hypothetical protein